MRKYVVIISLCVAGSLFTLIAQEKSKITEVINGKTYYIHNVKKGESLYGISKLYGVDSERILNENPLVKEKGLKAGTNILIPVEPDKKSATDKMVLDTVHYKYHKVLQGQTVYSICKTYGISEEQFYVYNPDKKTGLKEHDWIIVGKKEQSPTPQTSIIQEIKTVVSDSVSAIRPEFEKKNQYKILLCLPFAAYNAEAIDVEDKIKSKEEFPWMSAMMIDFYKGWEYVADSLASAEFKMEIVPLDINETDSLKLVQINRTAAYQEADVVIGPVFSSLIKTEQLAGDDKKVHIIPFISQNKFLFNRPEYSKTTPSVYVDIQALAHYIFDSLRKTSKVILLQSTANSDKEYAKEFRRYYNELVLKSNGKDTVQSFRSVYDFKKAVKEKQPYTVVLFTNNQVISTDYITQLSIINKTSPVRLCGFYKTLFFDNLDMEYLNQMTYTFAHYQQFNYKDLFPGFVKRYKAEFQSDPSVFFYEGVQLALYYGHLLKTQGLSAFYDLDKYPQTEKNTFIRFMFYRPDESTGFQNNAVFIFQVKDRKVEMVR